MRTGTLTFHGSHNYGSLLQAYALQQTMISIFGYNEIINFRSERQKRMMRVFTMRPGIGPILKDITHIFFYNQLKAKYEKFELFIKDDLILSNKEISEVESDDLAGYDLICCGSDQIWNPAPEDFDIAYLLPFDISAKKISYAASMGPGRDVWPEPISRFPNLLKSFDAISVREHGTRNYVAELSGREDISVNCDPVFLLNKQEWASLIDGKPIIQGKYIFLYTLFANPTIIECTKALADKYGVPVVISNFTNVYDLFAPFKKSLKSGPREFLNLLANAEMVVTSSFHGTAFATLLNKPFVTINGIKDNRIANLLNMTGLSSRSVSFVEEMKTIDWKFDFETANNALQKERIKAIEYLSQFKH